MLSLGKYISYVHTLNGNKLGCACLAQCPLIGGGSELLKGLPLTLNQVLPQDPVQIVDLVDIQI